MLSQRTLMATLKPSVDTVPSRYLAIWILHTQEGKNIKYILSVFSLTVFKAVSKMYLYLGTFECICI